MNKAELIEVVAARIDASKKDAGEAVQAVVDAITEAVAKGQKVSISGFGVFEKAARPARTYRTPSTGEAIQKLATAVPKFRPGGDFRAFVAGDKNLAEITRQAEGVVRRVTGKPAAASAEDVESAAPAKKAASGTAKKATSASGAAAKQTTTTAKKTPAPAKKAPAAKKTAATKSTATKSTAAKKAPAPRKTTAKKAAASAPAPAAEAATETE